MRPWNDLRKNMMAVPSLQRHLKIFLQRGSARWLQKAPVQAQGTPQIYTPGRQFLRQFQTSFRCGICSQEAGSNVGVRCAKLEGRGLVRLEGPDATELLQGLVTNDTGVMWGDSRVMYSLFLNTQGRILFDVMCYRVSADTSEQPSFLLECDAEVQEKLTRHLKMYRVRKKAEISTADDQLQTWAVFSNNTVDTLLLPISKTQTTNCDRCPTDVTDPRVEGFGRRVILPKNESLTRLIPNSTEAGVDDYTLHRYQWGVPEGVIDLPMGESLPLESNLAFMNGVSFSKGCYLGQELTARTHYTGVTRKRIMPIEILSHGSSPPDVGAKIISEAGKNIGKLRSYLGNRGLALLRVAQCKDKKLLVIGEDGSRMELAALIPTWWPQEQEELRD
ncbi:putative transferase CAF17 homolog, mitochondrial isoform X1 [Patiria miniata]|uniref:Aminomethyltransferase folate-binding domain-containing protein n=2 Tax=Patiria miniata TaxID=46514 RepID=A0A914BF92_PATMI|nr:putative transferase CAF17 homolog, mitochondrial isoform X1 [Patiria miniata]